MNLVSHTGTDISTRLCFDPSLARGYGVSMSLPGTAWRKLPIGVQAFRKVREEGRYYVGKTPWIERLVDEGNQ